MNISTMLKGTCFFAFLTVANSCSEVNDHALKHVLILPNDSAYESVEDEEARLAIPRIPADLTIHVEHEALGDRLFQLYPNEQRAVLYMISENFKELAYQIFDSSGFIVMDEVIESSITRLDYSVLEPGDYLLTLTDKNDTRLATYSLKLTPLARDLAGVKE